MAGKKILIVEDDRDVAMVLAARLKSVGYEASVAVDGVQGISFAHKQKPDLIILDLMLPAGGGMGVLEKLRTSVDTFLIPIVILTASKDATYKKKALEKGVNAYMEKPYDGLELLNTIKNILEGTEGKQG